MKQCRRGSDELHKNFLTEYRSRIVPQRFNLQNVENYNTFTHLEMESLENNWMEQDLLKDLLINSMKLPFICDAVVEALVDYKEIVNGCFRVSSVIRILYRGEFYRFFPQTHTPIKLLINNRTTAANVKIAVIGVIIVTLKRLTVEEISKFLLLFSLQESLYGTSPNGIPGDQSKILNMLRKIQRVVASLDLKGWFQDLKASREYNDFIEPQHFLCIASMAEKTFASGFSKMIFSSKPSLPETVSADQGPLISEQKEEKIRVRGLSFYNHPKFGPQSVLKKIQRCQSALFRNGNSELKSQLENQVSPDKILKIQKVNRTRIRSAGFKPGTSLFYFEQPKKIEVARVRKGDGKTKLRKGSLRSNFEFKLRLEGRLLGIRQGILEV